MCFYTALSPLSFTRPFFVGFSPLSLSLLSFLFVNFFFLSLAIIIIIIITIVVCLNVTITPEIWQQHIIIQASFFQKKIVSTINMCIVPCILYYHVIRQHCEQYYWMESYIQTKHRGEETNLTPSGSATPTPTVGNFLYPASMRRVVLLSPSPRAGVVV